MFTRSKIMKFLHGEYDLIGRAYADPESGPIEGDELDLFHEETLRAVATHLDRAISTSEQRFVRREVHRAAL